MVSNVIMFIKNGSFKKYRHIISYMPVVITQQPLSGIATIGSTFVFSINVKGSAPITYQWYRSNFPISNAKTNTLTLSSVQLSSNNTYYCKIGNNKYTINSNTVRLSVI